MKDWQSLLQKLHRGDLVRKEVGGYFVKGRGFEKPFSPSSYSDLKPVTGIILGGLAIALFVVLLLFFASLAGRQPYHTGLQKELPQSPLNAQYSPIIQVFPKETIEIYNITQVKERLFFGNSTKCIEIRDTTNHKTFLRCDE